MTKYKLGSTILAALVVLSVFAGGFAGTSAAQNGGETIVVAADGSGDYESVQAAVDAASDGDTVEVESGEYQEEVQVSTPNLTLISYDRATINASEFGTSSVGVNVTASGVTVEGLDVTGYSGVTIHSDDVNVLNNQIDASADAVLVGNESTGAYVERNTLSDGEYALVHVKHNAGAEFQANDIGVSNEGPAPTITIKSPTSTQFRDNDIDAAPYDEVLSQEGTDVMVSVTGTVDMAENYWRADPPNFGGDGSVDASSKLSTEPTTGTYSIEEPNTAPVASAELDSESAETDTEFFLSAENSTDADGDNLSQSWSVTASPDGSNVSVGDGSAVVGATADTPGEYTFEVSVEDEHGATSTDTVTVTVEESTDDAVAAPGADGIGGQSIGVVIVAIILVLGAAAAVLD